MMVEDRFTRYRGAMAGLAVGDALGAPLEGLKAGHIQQLYGSVEGYVDPAPASKDKPWRFRMPGLYTDDTQQALLLADALVKCHGFDPGFFAQRLIEMAEADKGFSFGAFRGTGRDFRESVRRLMGGVKPLMAGSVSAGIGAGMRVAPVGLYFADDIDRMTRAAVEQGLLTNRDPRALEAAAGVAFCAARGASGEWDGIKAVARAEALIDYMGFASSLIKEDYLSYLPLETWDYCGLVASAVRNFRFYVDMELNLVWKQIVAEANKGFPSSRITSPSQGFALAGPVCAMFLGINSRGFPEGVIEAVSLGRDADSVGAVTGAILGARAGLEQIPQAWLNGLLNKDQVILRGDALLQSSFQGLAIEDVVKMEKALTMKESEARESLGEKLQGRRRKKEPKKGKKKALKDKKAEQAEPTKEELISRRRKLKKPERIKAPWRGGKG